MRGMPKRWVLRAKGAPYEIRPPTAREDASEVWRYADRGKNAIIVGFAGPEVAWVRDDASPPPGAKPAAPVPTTPAAVPLAPAKSATQGAQNRKFVLPGRYCEHVFAEIKPTTNTRVDLGLCLIPLLKEKKKLPARLIDTGGFAKKNRITTRIPISTMNEIDTFVEQWLKRAYELAGRD